MRKTYIVRVSPHRTIKTISSSPYNAKVRVWNHVKVVIGGKETSNYGTRKEFMRNATIE